MMNRKELCNDAKYIIEGLGFALSNTCQPYTYQKDVPCSSVIDEMRDYSQFVLYTPSGTVQIFIRYQDVSGTTIQKLAYIPIAVSRSNYNRSIVVYGGRELLKKERAKTFLDSCKGIAPNLDTMRIEELENYLINYLNGKVA